MSEPLIPYGRQSIDARDLRAVREALESDFLTQGPRVERFERALAERIGSTGAVAVANGTLALEVAYAALDVGPGDLVLVPAITFLATASAAARLGAEVGFVDVDPDTALIDVDDLDRRSRDAEAAGRRVALVAPVHFAGAAADVRAIRARLPDSRIVEDAAHALGASLPCGSPVGACHASDATIFSFHPVKHITTAEGGAITFADKRRRERALRLRSHGMHKDAARFSIDPESPFVGPWYYECEELSTNARLSDVHAALGASQLARLDAFLARRRELSARYDAALSEGALAEHLVPLRSPDPDPAANARHLYVARVRPRRGEALDEVARRRRALFDHLATRGVRAQIHYVPLPWQPAFRRRSERFVGAEAYYAGCLSLPLFHGLTDSEHDRVVDALREWATRGAS